MSTFRFQARNAFLTYPQANNISNETLLAFLKGLDDCEKVVVAMEEHETEGVHYHALVQFTKKKRTRNQAYFDYEGNHPNIQIPRNLKDVFDYVTKDNNFINDGWDFTEKLEVSKVVRDVVEMDGLSHEEVVAEVMARTGDRGLRLFNQVDGYVKILKKPSAKHEPLMALTTFKLRGNYTWSQSIADFQRDVLSGAGPRGDRKSLWLHGESRLGKTMLARSIGVHWYMNGMWNVDAFDDDAAYGVLDDIPWENLKGFYKGIMGLQQDITVTDKYRRKSTIKHGKPVIIITNELPDFSQSEMNWMEMNVNFCGIYAKCFYGDDEGFGQEFDIMESE